MKAFAILYFVAAVTLQAQSAPASSDLQAKLAALPELVHSKQMEFGSYSDEILKTVTKDPSLVPATIPILRRDLQDSDPAVRRYVFAIIYGFSIFPNGDVIRTAFVPEIAHEISSGPEGAEGSAKIALLLAAAFGEKIPQSVLSSTENVVDSSGVSERRRVMAARVLMIARPADEAVQNEVIKASQDPTLSVISREQIIRAMASKKSGETVLTFLVQHAEQTEDKGMRDAAIESLINSGPSATARIAPVLNRISQDPSESLSARQIANRGMIVLKQSSQN